MKFTIKIFLKRLLIFIFTGNTNIAEKFFIKNGCTIKIEISSLENLKKSTLQLLLMKLPILSRFIFAIILVKIMTIFFQEKQLWITNFGFVGPYLKEEGDPEYFWMIECNGLGLHFP